MGDPSLWADPGSIIRLSAVIIPQIRPHTPVISGQKPPNHETGTQKPRVAMMARRGMFHPLRSHIQHTRRW